MTPAVEIIDARIEQFDRETKAPRKVFDTIADFAANAGIVTGGRPVRPTRVDLRWVGAMLYKNGVIEETGLAAACSTIRATASSGSPTRSPPYDEQLNAGDVVLGGSFTRPTTAAAATSFASTTGRSARSSSASPEQVRSQRDVVPHGARTASGRGHCTRNRRTPHRCLSQCAASPYF